jgi:hypothetical protein
MSARTQRPARCGPRAGTVLIIVAGVSALLSSLALVFLLAGRTDLEEMQVLVHEAQARLMLTAACTYIQESSRIGWEPAAQAASEHTEAHGWIDVRDGGLGPRANTGAITAADRAATPHPVDPGGQGQLNFPIGVPRRFPMHVLAQPPYAIQLATGYNPVQMGAPDSGKSYLRYPDPQPVTPNGWRRDPANPAGSVSNANFAAWAVGDPTPRLNSVGQSWFRLVREPTGAVFTVTCGCGGTQGFRIRDWNGSDPATAMTATDKALFGNDYENFRALDATEIRLWYRVEWNAATTATDMNYLREHTEEHFIVATPTYYGGGSGNRVAYSGTMMAPNMGGTIQWIQRLRTEPAVW